jgi:hypothetical protein
LHRVAPGGNKIAKRPKQDPPAPDALIDEMRHNKALCTAFADCMVRAVHGKCGCAQKAGSKSGMFSEHIPVSQEAFALPLCKNGHNNWIWMNDDNASSSDGTDCSNDVEKPGHPCTGLRSEKGAMFARRNGGWSEAGMEAFNSLCAKVKASRAADNGVFDTHCKSHWRSKNCVSKHKKRRLTVTPAIVRTCDDLVDPEEATAAC